MSDLLAGVSRRRLSQQDTSVETSTPVFRTAPHTGRSPDSAFSASARTREVVFQCAFDLSPLRINGGAVLFERVAGSVYDVSAQSLKRCYWWGG